MMTDLMAPSKRPRAPSFCDKHPENHSPAVSDWVAHKEMSPPAQVKNFLELCRFCKKSLRHDEDVFMYGYLGAFCSKECRAKQMAFDIFKDLPRHKAAKPKKGRTSKDEGLERMTASSRFYI